VSTATWPQGVPTSIDDSTAFIQQADFFKFRGHGLIQSTFRGEYESMIRFIKSYNGTQTLVLQYRATWGGMSAKDAATASTNADWDALFGQTDMVIPMAAIRIHNSGHTNYMDLSTNLATLKGTGHGSLHEIGKKISGQSFYGDDTRDDTRDRVLELLGALELASQTMAARKAGGSITL
jgi:hypothetical protein